MTTCFIQIPEAYNNILNIFFYAKTANENVVRTSKTLRTGQLLLYLPIYIRVFMKKSFCSNVKSIKSYIHNNFNVKHLNNRWKPRFYNIIYQNRAVVNNNKTLCTRIIILWNSHYIIILTNIMFSEILKYIDFKIHSNSLLFDSVSPF